MTEPLNASARVLQLDSGYRREVRELLYQVCRREPSLAWIFDSQRPGYERRLRVMVREWVRQHFYLQLPAIGLLVDDRLVGVALIAPPRRRLGVADSWVWRLRMMLGAGLRCTRRYLDHQTALDASRPSEQVHVLPLLGLDPAYQGQLQGQHYAEQLLQAVHDWCAEDPVTQGVLLDTGNAQYLAFYERHGYQELGEIAVGPVRDRVFFHPKPLSSRTSIA